MTFLSTGILIFLPVWPVLTGSLRTLLVTRSTNTIGCVWRLALVYKKQTETKASPYAWRSQVDEHTAFHSGYSVPAQIFLGGNVLMTIIIYSEDVLKFLESNCEVFWIPLEGTGNWELQEKLAFCHHLKIQSDCNRRWVLRTNQQTPDDFTLKWQLAYHSF